MDLPKLPPERPARRRIALAIAVAADAAQLAIFPAFFSGAASPLADGLDVVVGILMVILLGWHLAFLPSFVVELLPGIDLFPTWTIAVLVATRARRR
jgi:hypothetical protein